ncbi:tape measure protein [Beggiatoa leptomitoformis]|uniref:Tape measure protein n=1 Tax=Beggiatoa leptomitoformis TaxID=288004 RepID=A0A2N9YH91_9GAMM|nr:tape measure protein [Beggiatoa leptomitoformis]ALG67869.1 tape measure protein [Beggiatoa leptomitoformis]AUI69870.1 tape measure protein [Beggiatoa leptomitoformis]
MSTVTVTVKILADGSALVGTTRLTREELAKLSGGMDYAKTAAGSLDNSFSRLANTLKGVVAAAVGLSVIKQVGSDFVQTIAETQQLNSRLLSLTGTLEGLAEAQDYASNAANKLNTDLQAFKASYASTLVLQQAGLMTTREARALIEGISQVAANIGASSDQVKTAMYGIAQSLGSGVLQMQELMQVAEPLPGILNSVARAAGVTVGQFRQMVSDGKITSEMYKNYLLKAVKEYDGAAQASAKNLIPAYTRLNNAYTEFKNAFEKPISDTLTPLMQNATSALKTMTGYAPQIIGAFSPVVNILGVGGGLYLGMKGLPVVVGGATTAFTTLSRAMYVLTVATSTAIVPTSRLDMALLALRANLAAQTTLLGKTSVLWGTLNTSLYGTAVAAQFASGWMGKLQVAGGLLFAAYAGWEIGSYLYEQFDIAKTGGMFFVSTTLQGWEYLKQGGDNLVGRLSKGWGIMGEAFKSPIQAIQTMFFTTIGAMTDTFIGFIQTVVSIGEYIPAVGDQFTQLNGYLESIKTSSNTTFAELSTTDFATNITKNNAEIDASLADLNKGYADNITQIQKLADEQAVSVVVGNQKVTQLDEEKRNLAEITKMETERTEGHKKQLEAIKTSMAEQLRLSTLNEKQAGAEQTVTELLKNQKFQATEEEKQSLISLQLQIEGNKETRKKAAQVEEQAIKQQADTLKKYVDTAKEAYAEIAQAGLNAQQKTQYEATDKYGNDLGLLVSQAQQAGEAITLLRDKRLELQKVGLSETQQKELDLTQQYNSELAKQVIEIDRLVVSQTALIEAQQGYDASGLTKQAREYLDLMKQVGEETAKQVITLNNQATAKSTGVDRIASLQEEITLLQLTEKERAQYNALVDIAPDQRDAVKSLLEQKAVLENTQKQWETMTNSAADYAEKVATGELKIGDAVKGFIVDINKQNIKDQLTKLKEQITSFFNGDSGKVTLEGALGIADAQTAKDVSAASKIFETYQESLKTGTDDSVKRMIDGVNTGIANLQKGIEESLLKVNIGLNDATANLTKAVEKSNVVSASNTSQTYTAKGNNQSIEAIIQAAVKNGISQTDFLKFASIETGGKFNADAYNSGSGASGLFQFVKSTAKQYGLDSSNVFDPFANANAAAKLYIDNLKQIQKYTNDISATDMYLAHQQGMGGYASIKSAQDTGSFTRSDTRKNILSNVSSADIKKILGIDLNQFKSLNDKEMAENFEKYWKTKVDAIDISKFVTANNTLTQAQQQQAQALTQSTVQKTVTDQQQIVAGQTLATANMQQVDALGLAGQGVQGFANATALSAQAIVDTAKGFASGAGDLVKQVANKIQTTQPSTSKESDKGLLSSITGIFDSDGMLSGVGDLFKTGGALESVGSAVSGLTDKLGKAGGSLGGFSTSIMSLFSGDIKGALTSGISAGLSVALPGVGTALGFAVTPVMNKLFGSWEVESQHLTASFKDLSASFAVKTVEVNKGLIGGGKKTTYSEVDSETNQQLQESIDATVKLIEDAGQKIGKALTDNFNFKSVIDMVHEGTDDFETQFARMQSIMVKNAFTEANIAGVDTSITAVMADKVQNVLKQASDGLYDKATQEFMWKPDTQKYAVQITGTVQDGLNSLIASTDWSGLTFDESQSKLQTYLTDAFNAIGVDVPQETFINMANDFATQIQDGMSWLNDTQDIVDPDAQFFKNMREIVNNFNEWDAQPEEVSAFINSLLGLKDAFKLVGYDAGLISQSLIDASGDIGTLSSNLDTFYSNFLSEEEQRTNKMTVLNDSLTSSFTQLGLEMPKSKDAFRALIDGMASDMSDPALFADAIALSEQVAEYFNLQAESVNDGITNVANGFDILIEQIDALATSLTAQDVGGWLKDSVLNATNAEDAGLRFSNAFANAFQEQMLSTVLSTVSNMVYTGLVEPMLQASSISASNTVSASTLSANQDITASNNSAVSLTAGGSTAATALAAGGQIAAEYIAGVVSEVKNVIAVMTTVMQDESIKAMLADLQPALQDIGSATFSAVSTPTSITAPYVQSQQASAVSDKADTATSNTTQEVEKEVESLDSLRQSLREFGTGLDDTDLKLYQLSDVFKNADLSMINFSGSAEDIANSINGLDDTQLRKIASETGISIDELEGYAVDYLSILREQATAEKERLAEFTAWQTGLLDYTANGSQVAQVTQWLTDSVNRLGMNADSAVGFLQGLNQADIAGYAQDLGITDDELQELIPDVISGLNDFAKSIESFHTSLNDFLTLSDPLNEFAKQTLELGVGSAQAAEWAKSQNPETLAKWAEELGISTDELMQNAVKVVTYMQTAETDARAMADGWISVFTELMDSLDSLNQGIGDDINSLNGLSVDSVARLKEQVYGDYTGNADSILQDPDELKKRISLAGDLRQAIMTQYEEQKSLLEEKHQTELDNANELLDIAQSLKDRVMSIQLNKTYFSAQDRFSTAQTQYQDLLGKAQGGDAEAAKKVGEAFSSYLDVASEMYASSAQFKAIRDAGLKDLTSLGVDLTTKGNSVSQSFQDSTYAGELKGLQESALSELQTLSNVVETTQAQGTNQLVASLKDLGTQFGIDINNVGQVIKDLFPQLGTRTDSVANAVTTPAVSDKQIADYVSQAVQASGGVNQQSVSQIVNTASQYGIAPDRLAGAIGVDKQTVSQTAAQYGQTYNAVSKKDITDYVGAVVAQKGITQESMTEIYNMAKQSGVTSGQLADALGYTREDVLAIAAQYGLPAFAEGGIVTKPTIGLIGEAGREAIIPLNQLPQMTQQGASPELLALIARLIEAQQRTQAILEQLLSSSDRVSSTVKETGDKQAKALEKAGSNGRFS